MTSKYSTAIMQVAYKDALWYGKYVIAGAIPLTCYDPTRCNGAGGSKCYETEADALAAILADPWIQATPQQMIQLADCSVYQRS